MINPVLFCVDHVAMVTNFWAKSAKLTYRHLFVALAFRNELKYRNADGRAESTYIVLKTVTFYTSNSGEYVQKRLNCKSSCCLGW